MSDAWSHREVHHQAERQIPAQQKPVLRRVFQLHEEAHRLQCRYIEMSDTTVLFCG